MKLKKGDQIVMKGKIVTIIGIIDDKYVLSNGSWVIKDNVEGLSALNQDNIIDILERDFFIKMGDKLYAISRKIERIGDKEFLIPYLEQIKY